MILKLENTTTHQTYEYEVKDMNNGEKLYFRFDIDTSNLVDGEYALKLYDGDKIIATDILKIGDFNTNTLQYKKGENIYIEVKLDESVQDVKNISISTIETTVLPDDGFNSMGKVDVNAQPLYDNAYNIGHTEGYNEGLESSYQVGYDDGYSTGNEEGYNNGYNVGNEDGFNNGVVTQKSKLEAIIITENGTYTKEDGYNSIEVNVPDLNGSYDEGYSDGYLMGEDKGYDKGYTDGIEEGTSNAGEIIAETAQVLDIVENGTYLTQYVDDVVIYPGQITGDFGDGTYFYDWGEIKNDSYNTEVTYKEGTVIELWWKKDNVIDNAFIFGNGTTDASSISLSINTNRLYLRKGPNSFYIPIDISLWQHIKIETNGFVYLNDEKVDGIDLSNTSIIYDDSPFLINGCPRADDSFSNGLFGMVKIDDHIFIPKDGGFINYETGEKLGGYNYNSSDGTYNYNEGDEVTGYFDDGTPFYGYGSLYKAVFYTDIIGTTDSYFEVWWKDLNNNIDDYAAIVGVKQDSNSVLFKVIKRNSGKFRCEYGSDVYTGLDWYEFAYDMSNWTHIKFSKKDGLIVNGELLYSINDKYYIKNTPNNKFQINEVESGRYANGVFGMVKIDGKTFIPTENGFMDYETGDLLAANIIINGEKPAFTGEYYFTENKSITIEAEGNLIKKVNVNVKPKINIKDNKIKFAFSNMNKVPEWADWEGIDNMSYMFYQCASLTTIPLIPTNNVTDMTNMFYYCSNLKTIPLINTSNVSNMERMFYYCGNITTIPELDTSNVINMSYMFGDCGKLTTVPPLDASKVERQYYGLFSYTTLNNLTDFGGLIGLKASMDGTYCFEKVPNLTYQSCINILNGLYDFTGNGETPNSSQGKLKVHSNFLTTVGDEISIGTNKGWTITA